MTRKPDLMHLFDHEGRSVTAYAKLEEENLELKRKLQRALQVLRAFKRRIECNRSEEAQKPIVH